MTSPRGIRIAKAQEVIEHLEMRGISIDLLERGDGVEMVQFRLSKGQRLGIAPDPAWGALEWLYVVEGSLLIEATGETLSTGDRVTSEQTAEVPLIMVAQNSTKVLYVTSKPAFHAFSQRAEELRALVIAVEEKDGYTSKHCERIKSLSLAVGRRLGLDSNRQLWLSYGAYFHDLGKVGLPDRVLGKKGPLTQEEWELMKRHPTIGHDMLVGTYLEPSADIVLQHHERLDGSGYPQGLIGDAICTEAQIVAVVDAFDAMTTERVYHHAVSAEVAFSRLTEEAGKLYNQDVVGVLRRVLQDELLRVDD